MNKLFLWDLASVLRSWISVSLKGQKEFAFDVILKGPNALLNLKKKKKCFNTSKTKTQYLYCSVLKIRILKCTECVLEVYFRSKRCLKKYIYIYKLELPFLLILRDTFMTMFLNTLKYTFKSFYFNTHFKSLCFSNLFLFLNKYFDVFTSMLKLM